MLETAPDDLAPLNHHTVKKGETLQSIAKKLKVSRADLAEANYLSARAKLSTGQRLIIPRPPATLSPEPATADAVLASNTVEPSAVQAAPAERSSVVYRVKRGDTLSSIARQHGITVDSVRASNRLRGSVIQVGQRLTIVKPRSLATN